MHEDVYGKMHKNIKSGEIYFDGNKNLINYSHLVKRLRKRKYLVEVDRKEILAAPGDTIDMCYLLESGFMISYDLLSGNRRIFDCYEEGMLLFCDYAVIDRPAGLYYEALEPMVMYSIRMELVKKLMKNDTKFARCCFEQITRNYLVTQDLLRKAINHSARWRICDFLLVFAARSSRKVNGQVILSQRISKTLMADLLFLNRATIMREFQILENLDLCHRDAGHFVIPDVELLRQYCDSID